MKVKISDDFGSTPHGKDDGVWTFQNESGGIYLTQGKYEEVIRTIPDGSWTLLPNSRRD